MRLSHPRPVTAAGFDEPNLVPAAGLVPVMRLAADAGLDEMAGQLLTVPTDKGANAGGKVNALVAGMLAGADSIDDMALLRHGAMGALLRAPAPTDYSWPVAVSPSKAVAGESCPRARAAAARPHSAPTTLPVPQYPPAAHTCGRTSPRKGSPLAV